MTAVYTHDPSQAGAHGEPTGEAKAQPETDVVADVAHALRNHFHRVYYWLDVLGERSLDDEGRAALEGVSTALRSIERLSGGTMTLIRQIDLTYVRMEAVEVVEGVAQGLRRLGGSVTVAMGALDGVVVPIDPSHVSRMIDVVGERLGVDEGREVKLDLHAETDEGQQLVVTIDAHEMPDRGDGDVERLLDWALAERVAELHGGRLVFEAAGPLEHRSVLVLPAEIAEAGE